MCECYIIILRFHCCRGLVPACFRVWPYCNDCHNQGNKGDGHNKSQEDVLWWKLEEMLCGKGVAGALFEICFKSQRLLFGREGAKPFQYKGALCA